MKRINRILFDSLNCYSEEDYNDFMLNNDCQLTFDEFVTHEIKFDFEIIMDSIINAFGLGNKVVVCGVLGLWNGNVGIVPKIFNDVRKAVNQCLSCADCFTIKQVNGHLEIESYHHDGTNSFEIHLLNEKGINTNVGDLSNSRYHKAIKEI